MIRTGACAVLLCSAILANAVDISISGTIKKAGGVPVAGAKVTTTKFQFSNFSDLVTTLTDSLGKFTLTANGVSTRHSPAASPALLQFMVKNNIIVFPSMLGSVSGRADFYSANGKEFLSIPFTGLAAGKQGIMLPRLMPGVNLMRLTINGSTFSRKLLSVGNGIYSQNGLSFIKTADASMLGKKTAVLDTLVVIKKDFINTKIPLDSYTKQNIVDSVSAGVLKKLFVLSDNMITGWKLPYSTVDSCFTLWSAGDLYQDIDGGFERYTNHGMLQAADITMVGPLTSEDGHFTLDPHSFIMDFGTEEKAKGMYDYTKSQYFDTDASLIPGYTSAVAFTKDALGGITAYAYYKQFYFELILSGYPEKPQSLTDAKAFMDYFKTKAQ